ncbi:hypothetical protein [Hyphobacterium marinum]|uniref:Uncharacterized protein n=1 Tax=Hyphobacterium marinum TaxID=3116574 RepID=A0ABU7LXB6_9PROT|nr:hypothetical protein [Hyphobacterium sp. Y6023]MEE2566211.1 hypothetical protein [Hyphobacterium sp. Y6023]
MRIGLGILVAVLTACAANAQSAVNWSILPNVRTGAPNEDLTFFATIANGSDVEMTCQPRFGGLFVRPGGVSGQARFYTFDGTDTGASFNQPVAIPAGADQDFVVSLSTNRAYAGEIIIPLFCTDPDNVPLDLPRIPLVNDFNVMIAPGNPPDIIMITDTLSQDGVARVGETGPHAALMTVAAVNIGEDATNVRILPGLSGFSTLNDGIAPTICETDADGVCNAVEARFAQIALWRENEIRTFAVRARVPVELGVPFYPDELRMDVGATDDEVDFYTPLITLFGRSGVAMDVERQTGTGPTPVQQCNYDQVADAGGSFSREDGIIVFDERINPDGNLSGLGYFRQSQNQFDSRFEDLTPFRLALPDGNSGDTQMTVFGMGPGSAQTDDDVANVNVQTRADGSLVISWNANPGFSNDFEVKGRLRCAGAPAQPRQPRLFTPEALAEIYDIDPSINGLELEEEIAWREGTSEAEMGELTKLYGDPATNVADAIMGALIIFSGGRPGGPSPGNPDSSQAIADGDAIGILVPSRYSDPESGASVIDCATLMLTGVQENEQTASTRNASVSILTRSGVAFDDAEGQCVR